MTVELMVDEPVRVLVRMLPNGKIVPTSFVWRDRTRYVGDVGRQWEERVDGKSVRCFLIKNVQNETYELRWDPAGDDWRIYRAWMHNVV
ncbi:hypothetical protein GC175_15630 [bacterium]|nr:hypothetical protein [bacterium]